MNPILIIAIVWLVAMVLAMAFIYGASERRGYTEADHRAELAEQAAALSAYRSACSHWLHAAAALTAWILVVGALAHFAP